MSKNKKTVFTGAAVAIVTPFKNDKLDYESLGKIIDFQIENHTDAIVICGTTGESPTLTHEEHTAAIDFAVKKVNGRIPVIAGTGSNDTDYAVKLSQEAEKSGAGIPGRTFRSASKLILISCKGKGLKVVSKRAITFSVFSKRRG